MITYILNSGLCLLIFFGFYKLFLERENMHQIKRFYLLGMLILAFTIPLVTFTSYVEVNPISIVTEPMVSTAFVGDAIQLSEDVSTITNIPAANYTSTILWSMYGFISFLFLLRFVFNLSHILLKVKTSPKFYHKYFTNVMVNENITPHTFFNYIFINKEKFVTRQIPQEVFWHEQTHASQKHSIDILFIEFLKVVFWFNPFLYFISNSIKLNHEFLADQAVLNKGVTTYNYQNILLTFSKSQAHPSLANAINYSSIKKRFTVMKTPTSKNKLWLKSVLILPLIAVLLVAFSQKETVEKETTPITKEIMGQLESQQVSTNKNNSSLLRKKEPTSKQFESWKDQEKFALWLDGKPIKNSELNKYDISDIYFYSGGHYSGQFRKKEYPQTYYFKLFTKNGYNEYNHNASLMGYSTLLKIYNKRIEKHLKTNDDNDIEKLKNHLDEMYHTFSKEEKAKWGIKLAPPVPSTKKKSQQKSPPLTPVQPESKNFENPNDVPQPATPQVNKGYVKVNKPKNLIQHNIKLTNKNGEVYYEKRTNFNKEDKQLIPPPPAPEKPKTTGSTQEKVDLKQYTYQMKAGESMSPETKIIHNKYESFLRSNPNYVSWMQIDLNTNVVTYSVHSAIEKVPNNLRKMSVELGDSSYVSYMDYGKPYDRAKDELAELNKKNAPKNTFAKNAIIPIKSVEQAPVFPECTGTIEEINTCSKKNINKHIIRSIAKISKKAKHYNLKPGNKKISVNFNINKSGEITDINFPREIKTKLLGSIKSGEEYEQNGKLQNAYKEAINSLPKLKPGKHNGQIVAVSYNSVGTITLK